MAVKVAIFREPFLEQDAESRTIMRALIELRAGESSTIQSLDTQNASDLKKLLALGLLPGDRIEMVRLSPSVVFAIGATQFAIDRELARRIRIV